jgi:hypothetical protein
MITGLVRGLALGVVWSLLLLDVRADSLFQVTASGRASVTVKGDSLLPLLRDAILGQGRFSTFANLARYEIELSYAGSPNLLTFSFSRIGSNTVAYVLTGPAGYAITNSDRGRLAKEAQRDTHDGPALLADLVRHSIIAVTDGNPGATTAVLAEQTFDEFALHAATREAGPGGNRVEVNLDWGGVQAGPFKGRSLTLPISYRRKLSARAQLGLNVPLNYAEVEDAVIYRAGLIAGLALRLVNVSTNHHWFWQVTPGGGLSAGVSSDLADGALVKQLSISSSLAYNLRFCRLTLGNQFSGYDTTSIGEYESDLSQQVMKNGLKFEAPIRPRWRIEAWGIHTHFFQTAEVRDYYTVGGALAYRLPASWNKALARTGSFVLSFYCHLGNEYEASHLRIGTEWKF